MPDYSFGLNVEEIRNGKRGWIVYWNSDKIVLSDEELPEGEMESWDGEKPARASSYTPVLADFEYKKIYLLKEMYLLSGNVNGTYGYVREIKSQGQVPCVYDILNLEVDQESDLMSHSGRHHISEDEYLMDPGLDECLITQRYMENEWIDISSEEYRKQKRELISEENSFVDLRQLGFDYHGINCDDEGNMRYTEVRMGKEEIDEFFRRFVQSL